MMTRSARRFLAIVFLGLGSSCADDVPFEAEPASDLDTHPLRQFDPLGAPPGGDDPRNEERVELGRLLFHDPILSSDGGVACVTCHSQYWGMSDGLPVSIGVGGEGPAGLGRTGPNATTRNASTLWNVAYRERLFRDGRESSLSDLTCGPLVDEVELARDPDSLLADLAGIPEYVGRFEAAFDARGDNAITLDHLKEALAEFQRTLISRDAPVDRFIAGDDAAMSADELAGGALFVELACDGCHTPPRFGSDRLVATTRISVDPGAGWATVAGESRGTFVVPSLRNVRETGPYFHDGSVTELASAIAFEAEHRGDRPLRDDELDLLTSFVSKSLMDRSHEPHRPTVVPSGLAVPADGFRVPR